MTPHQLVGGDSRPRDSWTSPHISAGRVLIVDDEAPNLEILGRLMSRLGYTVNTASSGQAALDALQTSKPDLILLDVTMPDLDGFEVCRRIKSEPRTRLIPVVLVTAMTATADRVRGIDAGADDFLSKPPSISELEARARSLTRMKRYTDQLDSAEAVILSLGMMIEARDAYTQGHCERLAIYAEAIGLHIGLDDTHRLALRRGAFLHDVGKVGIADAILLKPGKLTPSEIQRMQQHTVIGHRLCSALHLLEDVSPIVRSHHERADGSGYPDGLKGEEIPVLARIIGVVDVFDALTTARPYKAAHPPALAFAELRVEVRNGWKDEGMVEEFIAIAAQREFGRILI